VKAGKQSAKVRKSVQDNFIWLMSCDLNLPNDVCGEWRNADFFSHESTQSARLSAQQAVQQLT
jgi:hypothetical protein